MPHSPADPSSLSANQPVLAGQFLAGQRLRHWVHQLLPAQCLNCAQRCDNPSWLCTACHSAVEANRLACPGCAQPMTPLPGRCACTLMRPHIHRSAAPLLYGSAVATLIAQWKFHGMCELTPYLCALAMEASPELPPVDVLVPVPMTWRKRWTRGFNQTELLACELNRRLQQLNQTAPERHLHSRPPKVINALRAQGSDGSQHRLGRAQRSRNRQSRYHGRLRLDGMRVLLVDDVLTTGATAAAAAQAIKMCGAERVWLWCLARTAPSAGT